MIPDEDGLPPVPAEVKPMMIAGVQDRLYEAWKGIPPAQRRRAQWVMSRRVAAGIGLVVRADYQDPGWRAWKRHGDVTLLGLPVEMDDAVDRPEVRYPIPLGPQPAPPPPLPPSPPTYGQAWVAVREALRVLRAARPGRER